MASVTRESIGNLHDKLTVKLEKQDYLPSFEKELKSLSKKANIPGFRKGMVPSGMIKKMYGKELFTDSVLKSAEDKLRHYLTDEKMDIFGQPLFLNDEKNFPKIDLQKPEDYEFAFEVGLRPEIEVKIPENASAIFYKVKVKPEDIKNRIDNFQAQYGELKEADKVEGPENIVYISISETDEAGNIKEGGFFDDTSLYVKVFNEDFQNQLKGKKKDDILNVVLDKVIDPAKYHGVYEKLKLNPEDSSQTGSHAQLKITGVNTLEKAAVNEELFKKAFPSKEIKTEEEFEQAITEDEQKYWNEAANNYLDHTLHHILSDIPVSLPEDFLKRMMNDPEKPLSGEEIEKNYPSFADQLKWSLIAGKIISQQELKVTPEEIRQNITEELKQYFGTTTFNEDDHSWLDSYVDKVMTDKKQTEQRIDKLLGRKIFDWAKTKVQIREEEISQEDFQKILESHQHHH